jgi:hypothetical protein
VAQLSEGSILTLYEKIKSKSEFGSLISFLYLAFLTNHTNLNFTKKKSQEAFYHQINIKQKSLSK